MRTKLITVLIIIIAPLVIAVALLKFNYKGKTTQAGNLITPPININTIINLPTKHWHLIYLDNNNQNNQQKLVLKHFKQIRNINNPGRISINILHTANNNNNPQAIKITANNMQTLLKKTHNQNIIIVDPRGFIILSYAGKTWPIQLNQDLKKLLKLSQIG